MVQEVGAGMTKVIVLFTILVLLPFTAHTETNEPKNIPRKEREALIVFYESTGGKDWIHQEGWLGPEGTECNWYGITCKPDVGAGQAYVWYVWSIELTSNNLVGVVPSQLTELKYLSSLLLHDNRISIAGEVLKKWDKGEIDFRFGTHYSSVSKITLTLRAPVLCAAERFILLPNGSVTWFHERCKSTHKSIRPAAYCEIKEGHTLNFDRLARFLEINGFFADRTVDPNRGVWIDVGSTEITVERNGISKTVEIGSNGDGSIMEWAFDKTIRGVAMQSEWTKVRTLAKCPID